VDVGEHAAGRDGDLAEQLGELLVVADGELDVARHDAALLLRNGKSEKRTSQHRCSGSTARNGMASNGAG